MTPITYQKGATFHAPTPSENPFFTPPSLPRCSQTSLSEHAVEKKTRLAALTLQDFDRMHDASPSPSTSLTVQSYRDEGLPFPQGLLSNTIHSSADEDYPDTMDYIKHEPRSPLNERTARPQRQPRRAAEVSDSGLGSSIMTKSSCGGAVTAITMSAAPTSNINLSQMSPYARELVDRHILQQLLAKLSFEDFHPMVRDCPRAIEQREIVCLRDLEKTLTLGAPHRAKTAYQYLDFCMTTIEHIRTALTLGNLSHQDQTRPQDRLYTPGYFTDLVAQVRQAAMQIAASREREAKGVEPDEKDAKLYDKIELYGGYNENGRPAELIRIKDGKGFSVMTGTPIDLDDAKIQPTRKRSLCGADEEDEAYRSMARRKRSATAAELAPKRCREPGCDKQFKRTCDLTKHEKTHTRPWKCDVPACKYAKEGWPTEKELQRHKNDRHSAAPKMYSCHFDDCTYRSKRESNAKQHMEKAHGWEYRRSKTTGKRKSDSASAQSSPPNDHVQSPLVGNMDEGYENQDNASVGYGQSIYSPDQSPLLGNMNEGYENMDNASLAHGQYSPDLPVLGSYISYAMSSYSPENQALPEFTPNLVDNLDMEMDVIPQLQVESLCDSPNSNLRHGSLDSSVPSPFGSNTLPGFQIENYNGAYHEYPHHNQFNNDFELFSGGFQMAPHPPSYVYPPHLPAAEYALPMPCGSGSTNDPVPQISPAGHGSLMLYSPPPLFPVPNAPLLAVDEGFDDFPGDDWTLLSSAPNNGT